MVTLYFGACIAEASTRVTLQHLKLLPQMIYFPYIKYGLLKSIYNQLIKYPIFLSLLLHYMCCK